MYVKNKLLAVNLYEKLPDKEKRWLTSMSEKYPFSFQQLKMITEYTVDMICWGAGTPWQFYNADSVGKTRGKQAAGIVFGQLRQGYEKLRNQEKIYPGTTKFANISGTDFSGNNAPGTPMVERVFPEYKTVLMDIPGPIMGDCPVASPKTRCCNLKTLDAVQQCGFDCTYCSIQSFYHGDRVRFVRNLASRLDGLDLDRNKSYHIGTGQSSDSLMWGNRFGLLDSLCRFAWANPRVLLEMKSKSARIEYFLENTIPNNMVLTWSLNTPVVIQAEERGTASLERRIQSAVKLAQRGIAVGFHLHPIIWYQGWQDDYRAMVSMLLKNFHPRQVVMVSLGTLTFIKPVISKIRERFLDSNILQMPMEQCADRLTYPIAIKEELFSFIYNLFPASWRESVFFYMCMEHIDLWRPVFGYEYQSNEHFENEMLKNYLDKIKT
ncbi:MAG: DNA photolyase [Desulfamplus sp.]|nr:DNA photolyase [Desulfamplus sp.]